MRTPTREEIIRVLLDSQKLSFAHRLGISVEDGSETALFQLLCASLLYNDSVADDALVRSMRLFNENNWDVPQFLYESTFEERLNALETADFVIFDERERYARWLGEMAEAVLFKYAGDLRVLRRAAYRDPQTERGLVRAFAGMNDRKTDIFLQEIQVAWSENYPFLPHQALAAAIKLGIAESIDDLALLVPNQTFPRFSLALECVGRTENFEEIQRKASELSMARK